MADRIAIRLDGAKTAKRTLRALGKGAPDGLAAALTLEAEHIMSQSRPLVPVDTGVLRGSGVVLPPRSSRGRVEVTMGYGGAASAYALEQHEREDYRHTVGQARYLAIPTQAAAQGMASRLGRHLASWAARQAKGRL